MDAEVGDMGVEEDGRSAMNRVEEKRGKRLIWRVERGRYFKRLEKVGICNR
jgi:hypothetical protein